MGDHDLLMCLKRKHIGQIIGPAAAVSARPVPMPKHSDHLTSCWQNITAGE